MKPPARGAGNGSVHAPFRSHLGKIWRILVAIAAAQTIGGLVGALVGPDSSEFTNRWLGGAVGTIPGAIMGAIWQRRARPSDDTGIRPALVWGLCALAVIVLAVGLVLRMTWNEKQRLEGIRRLRSEALRKIDVFDRYGTKRLAQITNPASLASFAGSIAHAEVYEPNHPGYYDSWFIVVEGETRQEFELHLELRHPKKVFVTAVETSGNTTWNQGKFRSRGLWSWVDAELLHGKVPNPD